MNKEAEFLELLRVQHQFPCTFTFKFIGLAEDNFAQRLAAAVKDVLGDAQEPPYTTHPSKNDSYVAVTLQPMVSSAEQVIAVYQAAKNVRGLKVSL